MLTNLQGGHKKRQHRKFSSRKPEDGNFVLNRKPANDGFPFSQLDQQTKNKTPFSSFMIHFLFYKKKHLVLITQKTQAPYQHRDVEAIIE